MQNKTTIMNKNSSAEKCTIKVKNKLKLQI